MKIALTLIAGTVLLSSLALAIEVKESELTTSDLASFLDVRYKAFDVEYEEGVTQVSTSVMILKNGEMVSQSIIHTDKTYITGDPVQRYSVIFIEEENAVDLSVRSIGFSNRISIDKPAGAQFPISTAGVVFDEKGRLVPAYDVEENDDGGKTITEENSSADGASWALVFLLDAK